MKRIYSLLSVVGMMVFAVGCEETIERAMTDAEAQQHVLDKIEKNVGISYDLFGKLEQIHSDSLKRLEAASETKEEFVSLISEQSSTFFEEVVKENMDDFLISSIPSPFAGEAEITLKLLVSEEPSAGAIPKYANLVLKRLEELEADGHKDWIIIENYHQGGESSRELPMESFSLNFAQIKMMTTTIPGILTDLELSDEEALSTIDEILSTNEVPPAAIGLLLPAVQKIREGAAMSDPESFNDAMILWLDGTVGEAIGGGLDRDIIRRIQAVVFLAGLNTLILNEYSGANQDIASLSVLHAQYRAATIMAYGEFWDQ